jgi:hypothetical protein
MYAQLRFRVFNTLDHAGFAAPAVSSAAGGRFGISHADSTRTVPFGGRFIFY